MAACVNTGNASALKSPHCHDAASLLRKKTLVANIQEIINHNGWSQRHAAKKIGMPQPKLCNMLNGQFHGISEFKLLSYLTNLGIDIRIVVGRPPALADCNRGSITVEFV